jgi:hypothetical protein
VWKESSRRLAWLHSYTGAGWSDGEACLRPVASCRSRREKRQREEGPSMGAREKRGGGVGPGLGHRVEGRRKWGWWGSDRPAGHTAGGGDRRSALRDSVGGRG